MKILLTGGAGYIGSHVSHTLIDNGNEVTIIDSGNFAASNNITIGRNSSNINGSAGDLVINTNSAAFTLVYANTARGWVYKTTKIS